MEGDSRTFKLFDLIEEVKDIYNIEKDFNFSILIEQRPIQNDYTYLCKVLAILIKNDTVKKCIQYDEVIKHNLNYVIVKIKKNQKIGIKTPTFIDGSSITRTYEGSNYLDFNFRIPNRNDLNVIKQLRDKFNIPTPFTGEELHFGAI